MSLLERIVIAHRCRSTHHYIAMDALPLIAGPDAEKWRNLMLVHNEELLKGAKAPDAVFKDFKNHVLHVGEGEWGGARDAAMAWYAEAVAQLQSKKWGKAVYALGVLSHYYADPLQPFHTGQTEEEGAMHRAVEWSIAKSRGTIKEQIEEIGYPTVPAGEGAGFISDMVRAGAEKSHPYYSTFIDHYNLDAGAVNPPAGLDQTMIDIIAELVAYATSGLSVIFSRAFAEAGVAAPNVHITVPGYLATLDIPVHWISKKLDNAADKRTVTAMYREYKKTGKVIKTLPDDDKKIRKLHARQVLRRPLKELDEQELKPLGQHHEPRAQYAEFAKEIAEANAPEDALLEGDTVELTPVAVTPVENVKPTKKKRMRVVADTQERPVSVAAPIVAAIAVNEDADRLKAEALAASQAKKAAAKLEQERAKAEETAAAARLEAEEADRLAAQKAEQLELERLEREALEELSRKEAEEAALKVAEAEKAKAQEALRAASEERERKAIEKKARLEAEELARIEAEEEEARLEAEEETARLEAELIAQEQEAARIEAQETAKFEAREAAEFARVEAEEAAELARMEAEEAARIAAEEKEFARLEAEEAERLAAEKAAEEEAAWAQMQDDAEDADISDDEFSLEELAAFDTNLTDDGDMPVDVAPMPTQEAPSVASFFDAPQTNSDTGRSRTRLTRDDPVIDAPSIGKKTARRLNRVGIFTIDDLLNCDVEEIAFELDVRHVDEPTLKDWKSQALLMIEVPGLRIHDAQILVGAGVRSAADLADASATRIFHASMGFLKTSEGARVVREDHVLREDEVSEWIGLAKERDAA